MLAQERLSKLQQLVQKKGTLQVSLLARNLGVSDMTVRRDLNALAKTGKITRVHGGAVANAAWTFGARLQTDSKVKRSLMEAVSSRIPKVGCIYMDGSTTVYGLCDFFEGIQDLQVVTNNLQTFQRLTGIPGIKPIILGGSLDTRTDSLVGPLARRSLQSLHFDVAFMSCYALHDELGCTEATLEDAEIKGLASERSAILYLAVHEAKLGHTAAGSWEAVKNSSVLVTNLKRNDSRFKKYSERFNEVINKELN